MRVFRKDNEGEVGEKGIKVVFVVGVCVCVLREPKYVRLFGDKCTRRRNRGTSRDSCNFGITMS